MLIFFALALAASEPASLHWLKGYWLSCENGGQTAEVWIGGEDGALVGVNQSRQSFEFMRISATESGGYAFAAMPGGAPATVFVSVEAASQRIVFEDPGHDFPQRVIYQRRGKWLSGRIEGETDSGPQAMEWRFRRSRLGAACPAN